VGGCAAAPPVAQIGPENDGCPTPLPSPQVTTAPDGSFMLGNAPNGHYILVIGNDTPNSATTTVHDNVTLTGGAQHLVAPTPLPIPTISPRPAETTGAYRISTLDATTEMPCVIVFNQQRVLHALPQVVTDQWLMENVRMLNAYEQLPGAVGSPWPGNPNGSIALAPAGINRTSGGLACPTWLPGSFLLGNPGVTTNNLDPQLVWMAAQYETYAGGTQGIGQEGSPLDPRTGREPTIVWP
jgi:hypothetical protein